MPRTLQFHSHPYCPSTYFPCQGKYSIKICIWCVCVQPGWSESCRTPPPFRSSTSLSQQSKARHESSLIQTQILFVGTDSEAVNVSSDTHSHTHWHKCTHIQVPEALFPLIWILLSRRQRSRCEAAVRCCVHMCHQPYGLFSLSFYSFTTHT